MSACLLHIAGMLRADISLCWLTLLKTCCWVMWPEPSASLSCSSSSRQKLWGRWLGGRRPLLVLVQRSLTVREEDREHGFISTSRLRLQRQVCRSEPTAPSDVSLTDQHIQRSGQKQDTLFVYCQVLMCTQKSVLQRICGTLKSLNNLPIIYRKIWYVVSL